MTHASYASRTHNTPTIESDITPAAKYKLTWLVVQYKCNKIYESEKQKAADHIRKRFPFTCEDEQKQTSSEDSGSVATLRRGWHDASFWTCRSAAAAKCAPSGTHTDSSDLKLARFVQTNICAPSQYTALATWILSWNRNTGATTICICVVFSYVLCCPKSAIHDELVSISHRQQ
jgi:hypothetical protein